jgi:hypothetical protein
LGFVLAVAPTGDATETPSELKPWPSPDGKHKERPPAAKPAEPQAPEADKKPTPKPERKPGPKPAPKPDQKQPADPDDPCACDKFLRDALQACDQDPECGTPERTKIYAAAGACRGQCPP